MTKKDYIRLTKGNFNIFDDKNINLQDKDVSSYSDCLAFINLYRVIIESQNIKIKTLKKRRDKWKTLAALNNEEILDKITSLGDLHLNYKNLYKNLYNNQKEKNTRILKLENSRLKKEIQKLEQKILDIEIQLEEIQEELEKTGNK
jgi:hypothetical protein